MSARLWAVWGIVAATALHAETGRNAWLRYAELDGAALRLYQASMPSTIVRLGGGAPVDSAQQELVRGVRGMVVRNLRIASALPQEDAIVVGALDRVRQALPQAALPATLAPDAFLLKTAAVSGHRYTVITGGNDRGVLYGAFAYLRKIATGETVADLNVQQAPYAPVRWVNQWDNLDGSIERGYGGRSIFWEGNKARADLSRVSEYGRLLASLGINGCAINNVNSNPRMMAADFAAEIARIADALRPWGVQTAISITFGSPKGVGGLTTFDPLDPKVIEFWKTGFDRIYQAIPDFGGAVLKADSEGQQGPSSYGRTHADAANVIARALKPHNGLIFYRGFVYNHNMDWNNLKLDRARAAYDNFKELDGKFEDNVVIQVKNGPIDFQVREPASPLFGALERTNLAVELQVTQEYFGQARHTVFLGPYWKQTTLDFDMNPGGPAMPVKAIVAGKTFHRPSGGFVGVVNVGLSESWLGNQMSQANLYAFGRLAWDPDLSSEKIIGEWTRQTFSADPKVMAVVNSINLTSWRTYENYTGPLGLQTLTAIAGDHYGMEVESSERNGWGQWHRADEKGVGMDRTAATGTGFIGQYRPGVAKMFETVEACPDDLLLFMHHMPYTHRLHSGKTVIQYIYDSHYEGADTVARYAREWQTLKGAVDDQRYAEVLAQLRYQAGQAEVWRDGVAGWFQKESGIQDAKGRVGHAPNRHEAEDMKLEGYAVRDVKPWEGISGGKAVACAAPQTQCAAVLKYNGPAGWYMLRVRYFDQNNGVGHFRVLLGSQPLDEWVANDIVPNARIYSSTSALRVIDGVALRPGDEIRIEGVPNAGELAALDYVEIRPESRIATPPAKPTTRTAPPAKPVRP